MEAKDAVASRIIKTEAINWRELRFIQNDDFKEQLPTDKHALKASIIANEFIAPFNVWEDDSGMLWCLDGRHRSIALEELIKEGADVPYLLPATFIRCESKKAASKLVLLYSSVYAKVSKTGLSGFLEEYDIDFGSLKTK